MLPPTINAGGERDTARIRPDGIDLNARASSSLAFLPPLRARNTVLRSPAS